MGRFAVRVDGGPIPEDVWRRRRAAEVVKLLALRESRKLHREEVMDALWPHLSPEAASANLRKAVHFARRALGSPTAIVTGSDWVGLWPDEEVTVDAVSFEKSARIALRQEDRSQAESAASLYVGELLPEDRYASWAVEPRERLRLLVIRVFKQASMWERVLDIEPVDEEAHRALMERALALGDRLGAIRQFEELRRRLRVDMGLGPDEASVALYEKAIDRGEGQPSLAERIWAMLAWGIVHVKTGDLGQARDQGERARGLALHAGMTTEVGEASALLGIVANARGKWRDLFRSEFADAIRRSPEITASVFDAHLCIAEFSLYGLSTRQEIVDCVGELLDAAEGSLHVRALAELLLGEVALISDRPDEAEAHLVESISLHRQVAAVAGRVLALQRLADSVAARGDRGRARRLLRNGLLLAETTSMAPHLIVRMHEGLVAAAAGDARFAAVAEGERALAGEVVCPPCSIGFRVEVAKALAREGRTILADERLEQAEELAHMWPGGPWHAAVWEARGELRRGQGDEEAALIMFREAERRFASADRPRDAARCRSTGEVNWLALSG